jgi:hypothetical protein
MSVAERPALGFLVRLHEQVKPLLPLVDDREVVKRVRMIWIDLEGAVVGILRTFEVSFVNVEVAEAKVDGRTLNPVAEGLDEDANSLVNFATPPQRFPALQGGIDEALLLFARARLCSFHRVPSSLLGRGSRRASRDHIQLSRECSAYVPRIGWRFSSSAR